MLAGGTMFGLGGIALADDGTCSPPDPTQPGIHQPVGADASTFSYRCAGPYTGKWTNGYYVYDPSTGVRHPLYDPNYTYNCDTGVWTMTEWDYSPGLGRFVSSRVTPDHAPNLPTGCSPAPTTASANAAANSSSNANPSDSGQTTIADTGPGSGNVTNQSVSLSGQQTNNTGLGLANSVGSQATSGDSSVVANTAGGSAASGDAVGMANIANLLQSTTNVFGPNTAVFTANINGDVNGDFMFDPSAILATGPNSTNTASNNLQVSTAANNDVSAGITNNIDVGANSGNATVADNTSGGNATSGNADAVVNLMNLINSTVAAGQSFVGAININGDLNGDILLPPALVNQLLASTGPNSNNSTSTNLTNSATTDNNVTEAVANNITSSATTGSALVDGNTQAGSATSGAAHNNVTVLNLTGSNTLGKNDLLVFVNVLGQWVGMIVNAPAGTTAAELGGSITSSGPNSSNTTNNRVTDTSHTTNNANLGITNNVDVHAASGNASVLDNTLGGSATTGNANTAVNVLNMEGSNISLSDWFGILFINVFGVWNGSFGVNTSAGDPAGNPSNNPIQVSTKQAQLNTLRKFASFTAGNGGGSTSGTSGDNSADFETAAVLGTHTALPKHVATTVKQAHYVTKPHASFTLPLVGLGLASLILLVGERDRLFKRR